MTPPTVGSGPWEGSTPGSTALDAGSWPAPRLLRHASGWVLRTLVVAAGVVLLLQLLGRVWILTVAVAAALLLAALVSPLTRGLRRLGAADWAAALVGVLSLLLVLGAAGVFVVARALDQLSAVQSNLAVGIDQIRDWLVEGPLGLSPERVDDLRAGLVNQVFGVGNRSGNGSAVLSNAMMALDAAVTAALALFLLFFFVKDGQQMWAWFVGLIKPQLRDRLHAAGSAAWSTLRLYVLGTTLVAFLDAASIGLALLLIGVPLLVPLVVLTFLAAYVPVAGAVTAGAVATLVALVSGGISDALLTLGAVLVVQQLEGNVFQPLIMGRALRLHPVVIVLAVTAGGLLAGVLGAVIAVPLVAVVHAAGEQLLTPDRASGSRVPAER